MFTRRVTSITFNNSFKATNALARRRLSLDFKAVPEYEDPLDETARSAFNKSCYLKMDWKVKESTSVLDAVQVCILILHIKLD
jgi:hypothetical protein